jgi:transcriptional repressor NrdR
VKCPFCGHTEDRVVDSRVGRDGEFIRRRRGDGRREPFDRQKLRGSILKACEKRSVGVQAVDDVVVEIEAQLHERAEKEISSEELGRIVMEHLQRLDPVAYVRFASVYRKFKDVGQFVDEVKGLQRDDKAKPAAAAKPKVGAKTK